MKRTLHSLLLIVVFAGVLVGCQKPVATVEPVVDEVAVEAPVEALADDLSVKEVESLWQDDAITVIDVREDFEFAAGHIPGAMWIPLGELPDRLDEVPTDAPVVMVCRSGNRSSQALNFLQSKGFENVHNMLGGMNDWAALGYEIEK